MTDQLCKYKYQAGTKCQTESYDETGLCFWHSSQADKTSSDIKSKLIDWLNKGNCLDGVWLKKANLRDLKLPRKDPDEIISFKNANCDHSDFTGAHLYGVDFTNTILLKANFENANLNRSILTNADLLGIKLINTKIEGITWGNICRQHRLANAARRKKDQKLAKINYIEAEEVYRNLRNACSSTGLHKDEGQFHYLEARARHNLLTKYSKSWLISNIVDLLCGYGEKPGRVISFSLLLIFGFGVLYSFLNLNINGQATSISLLNSGLDNLIIFLNAIYYSMITFTTVGYGDITPLGITKLFAAIEAFFGAFSMALFVVVFVNKTMK